MFVGHAGDVECVTFHPNSNYVVTGGVDRTVRMWDANSGGLARTLQGHVTGVTAVCVSPDGNHIASGDVCLLVCHLVLERARSPGHCRLFVGVFFLLAFSQAIGISLQVMSTCLLLACASRDMWL